MNNVAIRKRRNGCINKNISTHESTKKIKKRMDLIKPLLTRNLRNRNITIFQETNRRSRQSLCASTPLSKNAMPHFGMTPDISMNHSSAVLNDSSIQMSRAANMSGIDGDLDCTAPDVDLSQAERPTARKSAKALFAVTSAESRDMVSFNELSHLQNIKEEENECDSPKPISIINLLTPSINGTRHVMGPSMSRILVSTIGSGFGEEAASPVLPTRALSSADSRLNIVNNSSKQITKDHTTSDFSMDISKLGSRIQDDHQSEEYSEDSLNENPSTNHIESLDVDDQQYDENSCSDKENYDKDVNTIDPEDPETDIKTSSEQEYESEDENHEIYHKNTEFIAISSSSPAVAKNPRTKRNVGFNDHFSIREVSRNETNDISGNDSTVAPKNYIEMRKSGKWRRSVYQLIKQRASSKNYIDFAYFDFAFQQKLILKSICYVFLVAAFQSEPGRFSEVPENEPNRITSRRKSIYLKAVRIENIKISKNRKKIMLESIVSGR